MAVPAAGHWRAAALFEDLHETITWHRGCLTAADQLHDTGSLSGEGLLLVPAEMTWPGVRKMIKPYQPSLAYPARGIATLWETSTPPPARALAALIGSTRAALLTALAEPSSTTALAGRLKVTPGAVSQHLSVLLDAGDAGMVTRSLVGLSRCALPAYPLRRYARRRKQLTRVPAHAPATLARRRPDRHPAGEPQLKFFAPLALCTLLA